MSRFSRKNESRLNVSNLYNENEDGAPVVSGISTFSSPNYFVPPSGSTAERPSNPGEGMFRFNTDSGHLEYYTGTYWANVIVNNNEVGVSTFAAGISAAGTGTRALFCRGNSNGPTVNRSTIDYITVSTFGNAQTFGDDLAVARQGGALASSTRALIAGRHNANDTISFVTISSTGDGQDFANLVSATSSSPAGISNETRGIFAGGAAPTTATNKMDYVTIASQGVHAKDFGNLTIQRANPFGCASSVRGIIAGGSSPTKQSSIDYITFSSTGDALDFGDMTSATDNAGMASNSTRGIFGGGRTPSTTGLTTIEFITIASTGNATDFGDLLQVRAGGRAAASSTRLVFGGGYFPSSPFNDFTNGALESVEIATTGNGQGFGDLTINREQCPGCSNGHGGL